MTCGTDQEIETLDGFKPSCRTNDPAISWQTQWLAKLLAVTGKEAAAVNAIGNGIKSKAGMK